MAVKSFIVQALALSKLYLGKQKNINILLVNFSPLTYLAFRYLLKLQPSSLRRWG